MESVMISIKPKWCELIASGEKTIEVRKTMPKLETPFKCYIYCTKEFYNSDYMPKNGRVIGEFICNGIYDFRADDDYAYGIYDIDDDLVLRTCLENGKLWDYGKGKPLYGWNISDLKIYDKPKELSEFYHYCGDNPNCEGCDAYYYSSTENGTEEECCSALECYKPLTRPPQSWCYVEEDTE